ncbi:hypothetical protein DRN94_003330 [archaeon]|nr:hypothetical protein [archaeon]
MKRFLPVLLVVALIAIAPLPTPRIRAQAIAWGYEAHIALTGYYMVEYDWTTDTYIYTYIKGDSIGVNIMFKPYIEPDEVLQVDDAYVTVTWKGGFLDFPQLDGKLIDYDEVVLDAVEITTDDATPDIFLYTLTVVLSVNGTETDIPIGIVIWSPEHRNAYEARNNATDLYDYVASLVYGGVPVPTPNGTVYMPVGLSYYPDLFKAGQLMELGDRAYDRHDYTTAKNYYDQAISILTTIKENTRPTLNAVDSYSSRFPTLLGNYWDAKASSIRSQSFTSIGILALCILGGLGVLLAGVGFMMWMLARRRAILSEIAAREVAAEEV